MPDGRILPIATFALGSALAAATPAVASPQEPPPAREGDRGEAERKAAEKAAAAPPADDPETVREERELAHRRRHMPEPMADREIAGLGERLELDAKGLERLAELTAEYVATWDAIREKDGRAMLVLLPASFSYDHRSQDIDPVHTPELLSFLRLRERHLAAIDEAETRLWRELEGVTDVERRGQFQALRLERTKTLHDHPARLPAAGVDLAELLGKCGLTPDEVASLAVPVATYREELGKALRKRDRALRELELRQAEEVVNLGPEWRAGRTEAEALAVDRQLSNYAVASILADTELRDLNRATLESMRKSLLPTSARKLVEAYQRLVHPALFEDERGFRRLVEAAIALPIGADDASLAALELLAGIEDRLRPTGYAAVDMADGILATEGLPPGDAAVARILLEMKLQQTLAKRRTAIREAVNQLRMLLPPAQVEFLAKVEDSAKTLAAQDRAGEFLLAGLSKRLGEVEALRVLGEDPALPPAEGDAGVQVDPSAPEAPPAATAPKSDSGGTKRPPSRGSRGSRGGR